MVYAIDISDPNVNPVAKFSTIADLANIFVPIATLIGVFIFGAMLFSAAFTVLTGEGSKESWAKARKTSGWAVFGLVVILVSYLLVGIISNISNIQMPF